MVNFLPQFTQLQPCVASADVNAALPGASFNLQKGPECAQVSVQPATIAIGAVNADGLVDVSVNTQADVGSFQLILRNKFSGEAIITSTQPNANIQGLVLSAESTTEAEVVGFTELGSSGISGTLFSVSM